MSSNKLLKLYESMTPEQYQATEQEYNQRVYGTLGDVITTAGVIGSIFTGGAAGAAIGAATLAWDVADIATAAATGNDILGHAAEANVAAKTQGKGVETEPDEKLDKLLDGSSMNVETDVKEYTSENINNANMMKAIDTFNSKSAKEQADIMRQHLGEQAPDMASTKATINVQDAANYASINGLAYGSLNFMDVPQEWKNAGSQFVSADGPGRSMNRIVDTETGVVYKNTSYGYYVPEIKDSVKGWNDFTRAFGAQDPSKIMVQQVEVDNPTLADPNAKLDTLTSSTFAAKNFLHNQNLQNIQYNKDQTEILLDFVNENKRRRGESTDWMPDAPTDTRLEFSEDWVKYNQDLQDEALEELEVAEKMQKNLKRIGGRQLSQLDQLENSFYEWGRDSSRQGIGLITDKKYRDQIEKSNEEQLPFTMAEYNERMRKAETEYNATLYQRLKEYLNSDKYKNLTRQEKSEIPAKSWYQDALIKTKEFAAKDGVAINEDDIWKSLEYTNVYKNYAVLNSVKWYDQNFQLPDGQKPKTQHVLTDNQKTFQEMQKTLNNVNRQRRNNNKFVRHMTSGAKALTRQTGAE